MNYFTKLLIFILVAGCTKTEPTSKPGDGTPTTSSSSSESSAVSSSESAPVPPKEAEAAVAKAKFTGWSACLKAVSSTKPEHGGPSVADLEEIVKTVKALPDSDIASNPNYDIFSLLASRFGPWRGLPHRRAVLAETMVVSAAFESDYGWTEGRDMAANNTGIETQEAGIFQTSCNIRNYGQDLKDLIVSSCGSYSGSTCQKFIPCSKKNHRFAIETHAKALRHDRAYRHWGPITSGVVPSHMRPACIAEIESYLGQ